MVDTQASDKVEKVEAAPPASDPGNFLAGLWEQAQKTAELAQKSALDAAEAARKAAEDAADKAKEAASQIQGNSDATGDGTPSNGNILSDLWVQAQKAAEQAQKAALDAADAAKKVAEDAADQAKKVANDAADQAKGVTDKAKDGLSGPTDTSKAAEGSVSESQDFFAGLWAEAQKAADAAQKAASDAAAAAKKAAEDTSAKALETAGSVQSMTDGVVNKEGSSTAPTEQVGNFFTDVWQEAQKAAEATQKAVIDASESTQKAVAGTIIPPNDAAKDGDAAGGNFLTSIWENAQKTAEQAQKAALEATEAAQKAAQDAADKAKEAAESAQKTVAGGPVEGTATQSGDFLTGLWEKAQQAAEQAQKAALDAAEAAKKAAEDAASKAKETAEAAQKSVTGNSQEAGAVPEGEAPKTDFVAGLWQQAQKAAEQAAEAAKNAADEAAKQAKAAAESAQSGIMGKSDGAPDQANPAESSSTESKNLLEDLWKHAQNATEAAKKAAEEAAKAAQNAAEEAANRTREAAASAQNAVSVTPTKAKEEEAKNPSNVDEEGFFGGVMATARSAAEHVQKAAGDAANTARKVAEDAAAEAAAAGQRAAALTAVQGMQSIAAKYPPSICKNTPLLESKLRVLTFNIWWRYGPWQERQAALITTLKNVNADVVCLQEVWLDPAADGKSQTNILADEAGYEHRVFEGKREIDGIRFGNAILSRWPIKETSSKVLPPFGYDDENRCVLRAEIDGPRGPFSVFNTHLNWRADQSDCRTKQVQEICKFMTSQKGLKEAAMPPILCGDFNAVPDSDEIRKLVGKSEVYEKGLSFVDAFDIAGSGQGYTWSNENAFAAMELLPSRRIDYIFVGNPREGGRGHVTKAEVVGKDIIFSDSGALLPSDHFALVAELRY